jgi:lipoprotein-anchoring transpeptidase ErfK/SrfK
VFATLISAGRGGAPVAGRDPVETASTPTGRFKITGKFATATMVAPNEVVHSEVPWAQNFSGPHALHAAYWHDDWGELASGGCINLSPRDARWLSEFSEPRLPEGWHGVRWLPELEASTTLIVRR